MTARAMLWAWGLVGHTAAAKLLAIWIGDNADDDGNAVIGIERACEWVGISEPEFGAAICELSASGLYAGPEQRGHVSCRLPLSAIESIRTARSDGPPDVPGHLYVITAGGKVKVGISRDIDGRLAWLQSGNPAPITVALKLADKSIRRMRAIEREVHKRLADSRVAGEWFDVEPSRAIDVVNEVAKEIP